MKKENDIMLNLLTRHTNLAVPYSDYVKYDEFPDQITELLNTEITIKYRNHYTSDISISEKAATIIEDGKTISSRPSDDAQQLEDREFSDAEKEEAPFVNEGLFRIIRADNTEPYRLIAISNDYEKIIINSTKKDDDGEYEFKSLVSEYAMQLNEYIGLQCYDQYVGELSELKSVTLRVDSTEPCYSVLMEYLDEDNVVRFILGDEAASRLYGYYDPNIGYVDNLDNMYNRNIMRDFEIYEFRKSVLEGKIIYGTV